MRILLVNKFLYPRGGSESYTLELGDCLSRTGRAVRYFGMRDARNTVPGGVVGAIELGEGANPLHALRVMYSRAARREMAEALRALRPDIVHLNNINYQLTPSIIYAVRDAGVPLVQTAHDSQMVCPSHRMYVARSGRVCDKCVEGR